VQRCDADYGVVNAVAFASALAENLVVFDLDSSGVVIA
jgi:hypothetical protein